MEDKGHLVSSFDKEDKFMAKAKAKAKSPYSVHPGIVMVQSWVVSLPQKTGRSLDEWIRLVKKEGPRSEKERRDWLKTNHGLGTNTAWWIAERAAGRSLEDEDPAPTWWRRKAMWPRCSTPRKQACVRFMTPY